MPEQPAESPKQTELQLMTAAVGRVEVAVESLIARSAAHRDENAALRAQIAAAEKKLAAAEQQVRQISETSNGLLKKNDDARRRIEELEHQHGLTANELERVRLSLQTRDMEFQGLTDALAASQRDVERLVAESAALADERAEARRAVEAVEQESGSYAQLLAQRDAVIAAREEEVNQLAQQAEAAAAQIAELKSALELHRTELAQLGETNGNGGSTGPLFSHEERDRMAERIKDIVGRLDRYLA